MLITGPQVVNPNRVEQSPVHVVDLYATILELAAITVSQPEVKPIVSRSLVPYCYDEEEAERVVLSEIFGSELSQSEAGTCVREGDYKMIRYQDGQEELYDLANDVNEESNLIDSSVVDEEVVSRLRHELDEAIASAAPIGAPLEIQWQTVAGAEYASIYSSQANALNGISETTWEPSGRIIGGGQPIPAYAGVESIRVSANWVYVKGSALPHFTMGPWYFDEEKTLIFVHQPSQWDMLSRFPRRPQEAAIKTNTNFGPIATWINTAIIHNQLDAFYWDGSADIDTDAQGTEYWTRNAYLAEGLTFDPSGSHQPFTGERHHHINCYGLRHELGDHVDYDPSTHTYTESSTPPQHSPVLGWSFDGYPIYGPYGYDLASEGTSTVRRMVSGYIPRDGTMGTDDLATIGRISLPQWALRCGHGESDADDAELGPDVSTDFPIGWYIQDFAYLGDLDYTQGQDFDLDEYNGRWCVTPEFPEGTYAYFTTLDADSAPAYPYVIGRQYYGVKQGGNYAAASTIGFDALEVPYDILYQGGANAALEISELSLASDEVTLTWESVEGGTYTVEYSDTPSSWEETTSQDASGRRTESVIPTGTESSQLYRVRLDSVAPYQVNAYE